MALKLISSFIINAGNLQANTTMSKNEEIVFEFLKRHYENVQFKPTLYSLGERIKRTYRPCITLHFQEHPLLTIVVEVDEDFHMDRDPELEVGRMKGIMKAYNQDWTYFIRFNPSAYMFDNTLNPLGVEARLKSIFNKIEQIRYLSRKRQNTMVPMDQRVFYLFYPETRVRQLNFEFFAQS
jgi:hypothetical protein